MLALRPEIQAILSRVEELSGKPVHLMRDDSLALLATINTARHGAPFHVLRYKPSNESLDYLVAYQAGFLIRLFENPPQERSDFQATEIGAEPVEQVLRALPGLSETDRSLLPQFAAHIKHWLMLQLRSLPIGMRIDTWLRQSCPALAALQERSMSAQHQQNVDNLSRRVGNLSIPIPYFAPNAAYALFSDRLFGDTHFAVPYRAAGALAEGKALLDIWDAIPFDSRHDRDLINRWAGSLGMSAWYRWVPFEP